MKIYMYILLNLTHLYYSWVSLLYIVLFLFFFYTRASYTASFSFFTGRLPVDLLDDDACRSVFPVIDGSVRGGALGIALGLFIWSGHSAPTSDHPASISLGTPMGTG